MAGNRADLSPCQAPFTVGVNLSGWLEHRPAEEIRADLFGRQDFENIRSLGCDVIRLPIHFERFCTPENHYLIPPKIAGILDHVAAWADELKIFVIFDFHNATHVDSVTSADVENILLPVWTQLAERYCGRFPYVIFEIMNEPHGIGIDDWNRIILKVFRAIRGIDADRYLVAGGADWNSLRGMKALPVFDDNRVIYTFHFYDPHTFTHQGAPWCHMERVSRIPFPYDADRMPPLPENPTETEKRCFMNYPAEGTLDAVRRQFESFRAFRDERKSPVFCGEFGCNAFGVGHDERINWYRIVTDMMDAYEIPRISWDYYGGFGLFSVNPYLERKVPEFPRDLDRDLLKALKLRLPAAE